MSKQRESFTILDVCVSALCGCNLSTHKLEDAINNRFKEDGIRIPSLVVADYERKSCGLCRFSPWTALRFFLDNKDTDSCYSKYHVADTDQAAMQMGALQETVDRWANRHTKHGQPPPELHEWCVPGHEELNMLASCTSAVVDETAVQRYQKLLDLSQHVSYIDILVKLFIKPVWQSNGERCKVVEEATDDVRALLSELGADLATLRHTCKDGDADGDDALFDKCRGVLLSLYKAFLQGEPKTERKEVVTLVETVAAGSEEMVPKAQTCIATMNALCTEKQLDEANAGLHKIPTRIAAIGYVGRAPAAGGICTWAKTLMLSPGWLRSSGNVVSFRTPDSLPRPPQSQSRAAHDIISIWARTWTSMCAAPS